MAASTKCLFCEPSEEVEDDLSSRLETVEAGLRAHDLLNKVNGKPAHFMGDAVRAAKSTLPKHISKAMSQLQRLAGKAKHDWPQSSGVPTTGSSRSKGDGQGAL